MIIEPTARGFAIASFLDRYGRECSLQKSSLADEECLWLGVSEDRRMHLTREMVAALLPFLNRFVQTGDLWEGD